MEHMGQVRRVHEIFEEYAKRPGTITSIGLLIQKVEADLTAKLAEALKYGAPENAKALSSVKNPCTKHNQYWTTAMGACMACRACDAEANLAKATEALRIAGINDDGEPKVGLATMAAAHRQGVDLLQTEVVELRSSLAAMTARAEGAEKERELYRRALQEISDSVPACGSDGGCFVAHFDQDGNEVGIQHVDPIGVFVGMAEVARYALSLPLTPPAQGESDNA